MEGKKASIKKCSVEEAMKRGEIWLQAVPMYIGLGGLIAGINSWTGSNESLPVKIADLVFLLLVPALLFRSFAVTIWWIWALERVRNVHELKKKSLKSGLLFPGNSRITWLEIKTPAQKEKLRVLQVKFTFSDDSDYCDLYPDRMVIGKSPVKMLKMVAASMVFIVSGVYLILNLDLPVGLISLAVALFLLYLERKLLLGEYRPLRIDNEGIYLSTCGFTAWSDIHDEEVQTIETGRGDTYWLNFTRKGELPEKHPDEHAHTEADDEDESSESHDTHISYDISYLDVEPDELSKILKVYRRRSEQGK